MTKHSRPPRDGGDQWRAFGHDVDMIPPDPQDKRLYEVLYQDHGPVTEQLVTHAKHQANGWVPEWWRLYKPVLPQVAGEPVGKLNDPIPPVSSELELLTPEDVLELLTPQRFHLVRHKLFPNDATVEYVRGNEPGAVKRAVARADVAFRDYAVWWRRIVDVEQRALTGDKSDYYLIDVPRPARGGPAIRVECLDVIEALGLTFNEGEAFKAIWRGAAARKGNGKPGATALYDAEKVAFYGGRMVAQAKP